MLELQRTNSLPRNVRLLLDTGVLALEAIDSARRVKKLLLAREKRMATGADFHAHVALVRRPAPEAVPARTDDVDFVIRGVNTCLHYLNNPFA
jgi:hypothetical protein